MMPIHLEAVDEVALVLLSCIMLALVTRILSVSVLIYEEMDMCYHLLLDIEMTEIQPQVMGVMLLVLWKQGMSEHLGTQQQQVSALNAVEMEK